MNRNEHVLYARAAYGGRDEKTRDEINGKKTKYTLPVVTARSCGLRFSSVASTTLHACRAARAHRVFSIVSPISYLEYDDPDGDSDELGMVKPGDARLGLTLGHWCPAGGGVLDATSPGLAFGH